MTRYDWNTWHEGYDVAESHLSARLAVVRERLRIALDEAPEGRLTVLSLCAGQGRDVIPVLADHPRRDDVTARLVEFDRVIAGTARTAAAEAGLDRVEVVTGDAALTDQYLDLAPADIVVACGIFGNVSDDDVRRTVVGSAGLAKTGGVVIWTRGRHEPDLVPTVKDWFAEAGFSQAFDAGFIGGAQYVGVHRLERTPTPLIPGERLFTFLDTPAWAVR
jgi:hypothetical protein